MRRVRVAVAKHRCRSWISNSAAFTIIELLIVLAILGLLLGLTFPAVQAAREASRRSTCQNNLRQLGLGLANFEAAVQRFPLGAEFGTMHAWSARILPFLEQGNLNASIDFGKLWDDPINQRAMLSRLQIFSCPTSFKSYAGATDYCGISGSYRTSDGLLSDGRNGVLFVADSEAIRPVRSAEITDGLSNTIAVGEGIAVTEINFGYWGCGLHCFTHEDGGVSNTDGGYNEIASLHPGGANILFCDGSTHFLSSNLSEEVVASLCTRGGAEVVDEF